jgi:hypothetical protein
VNVQQGGLAALNAALRGEVLAATRLYRLHRYCGALTAHDRPVARFRRRMTPTNAPLKRFSERAACSDACLCKLWLSGIEVAITAAATVSFPVTGS